jgi:hypothetical protein
VYAIVERKHVSKDKVWFLIPIDQRLGLDYITMPTRCIIARPTLVWLPATRDEQVELSFFCTKE